jgi:hypothetical protein
MHEMSAKTQPIDRGRKNFGRTGLGLGRLAGVPAQPENKMAKSTAGFMRLVP